jgi:hypothetical protein
MTQTFGLNAQHDLYLGPDGNLVVLSGVEAVAAACQTACLTQLSECVLETGIGLPNFQTVWVGTPDLAIWQSYLQDTMLNVDGVTQVDSIQLVINDNVLNFTATISTIYGPTTISG